MSCARPVVLGVEGQAQQIVEESRAGIVIEPENASALARSILTLRSNPGLGSSLGQNGREYILKHYSRARTAATYVEVLEHLLGNT